MSAVYGQVLNPFAREPAEPFVEPENSDAFAPNIGRTKGRELAKHLVTVPSWRGWPWANKGVYYSRFVVTARIFILGISRFQPAGTCGTRMRKARVSRGLMGGSNA